ncbi:MAG: hypothetical protein KatS3mg038_1006 [Candidatus Kapaibacterium sp.]|nr:MAG: hypothetical protein KatS3mg038_1006 [Candidatus Kapabacteria bacterium]
MALGKRDVAVASELRLQNTGRSRGAINLSARERFEYAALRGAATAMRKLAEAYSRTYSKQPKTLTPQQALRDLTPRLFDTLALIPRLASFQKLPASVRRAIEAPSQNLLDLWKREPLYPLLPLITEQARLLEIAASEAMRLVDERPEVYSLSGKA